MNHDDIKNTVIKNQEVIDRLNDELSRKNQEIKIIQEISSKINTSLNLDEILDNMLRSLDKIFGFEHSMILLLNNTGDQLYVAASYGYEEKGIGAKVNVGQGMIGVVAKKKKLMRMGNIGVQMAYMNAVKAQMGGENNDIKLPGLANVQSQVAIPLLLEDELIGVLSVESNKHNVFDQRDELIISIIASQAANAIEKAKAHSDLKELNENLEEKVKERTEQVVKQKEELQTKNKEITDSIRYAKRIQESLLTNKNYIAENMPNSFVLYLPKDIVSGDFYWINAKEDAVLFAAVDCTGHGVPGAFVSIVAHGGLQRALHVFGLRKPSEILNKVNEGVSETFRLNQLKDGMDISLCKWNKLDNTLEFAGANNPLYLLRKGHSDADIISEKTTEIRQHYIGEYTIHEVRANRQAIGFNDKPELFVNHLVKLEKGDRVYLFSDGYSDQFGGPITRKIGYRRLREYLVETRDCSISEQKEKLHTFFNDWKKNIDQIDDVCVIGVEF